MEIARAFPIKRPSQAKEAALLVILESHTELQIQLSRDERSGPSVARMHNSNANDASRATRFYASLKVEGSTLRFRTSRRCESLRTSLTDFSESIKTRCGSGVVSFHAGIDARSYMWACRKTGSISMLHRDQFVHKQQPPLDAPGSSRNRWVKSAD